MPPSDLKDATLPVGEGCLLTVPKERGGVNGRFTFAAADAAAVLASLSAPAPWLGCSAQAVARALVPIGRKTRFVAGASDVCNRAG